MSRAEVMQYTGAALVTVGVLFIYWPLALVVAGLSLAVLAEAVKD